MFNLLPESSWKTRKQTTIDFLEKSTKEEQIICLADKLSNMREIYREDSTIGDKIWERFNQKDKGLQAWYYGKIMEKLILLKESSAYKEYVYLYNKVFNE